MEVCYIVLHYKYSKETIACVDSILKNHGEGKTYICIVDNCSDNNSVDDLEKAYSSNSDIFFCKNNENLGFANGMNSGIDFMRNKGFYGFFVLLNNDTIIDSKNWDTIINEKYRLHHFGVLGPDCYSRDKKERFNPFFEQKTDVKSLNDLLKYKKRELYLNVFFIRQILNRFRKKCVNECFQNKYLFEFENNIDIVDVPLQGSCLILSPDYIDNYGGLYSKTFLYFEEAILRHRCKKINRLFVLSPSLKLIHNCSNTVNRSIRSDRKKEIFYLKHSIKSVSEFYLDVKNGLE